MSLPPAPPSPLHLCALTERPHTAPVAAPDGTIFDRANIHSLVSRTHINPITGSRLHPSSLLPIVFTPSTPPYRCPLSAVPLTAHTGAVALASNGLVISLAARTSAPLSSPHDIILKVPPASSHTPYPSSQPSHPPVSLPPVNPVKSTTNTITTTTETTTDTTKTNTNTNAPNDQNPSNSPSTIPANSALPPAISLRRPAPRNIISARSVHRAVPRPTLFHPHRSTVSVDPLPSLPAPLYPSDSTVSLPPVSSPPSLLASTHHVTDRLPPPPPPQPHHLHLHVQNPPVTHIPITHSHPSQQHIIDPSTLSKQQSQSHKLSSQLASSSKSQLHTQSQSQSQPNSSHPPTLAPHTPPSSLRIQPTPSRKRPVAPLVLSPPTKRPRHILPPLLPAGTSSMHISGTISPEQHVLTTGSSNTTTVTTPHTSSPTPSTTPSTTPARNMRLGTMNSGKVTVNGNNCATNGSNRQIVDDRRLVYKRIRKGRKGKGYVRVVTNVGHLNIEIHCDKVPLTCDNFLTLAERQIYNGNRWHQVRRGYLAQVGNPNGQSAWGGSIKDEIRTTLTHDSAGVVSMWSSGRDTNRCMWFVCFDALPRLNKIHTVFGKVVGGLAVLKKMEAEGEMGHPLTVERIEVLVNPIRQCREQLRKEREAGNVSVPRPLGQPGGGMGMHPAVATASLSGGRSDTRASAGQQDEGKMVVRGRMSGGGNLPSARELILASVKQCEDGHRHVPWM